DLDKLREQPALAGAIRRHESERNRPRRRRLQLRFLHGNEECLRGARHAPGAAAGCHMSLYQVQKFLYTLNRDPGAQHQYRENTEQLLDAYDLTGEERTALATGDIGLLYVLGVNGQILMHYAAFLGIEWFDYLEQMREGVSMHGPVRAGIYAMTGGGDSFTPEGTTKDKGSRK